MVTRRSDSGDTPSFNAFIESLGFAQLTFLKQACKWYTFFVGSG
jgi:hypothetical protein